MAEPPPVLQTVDDGAEQDPTTSSQGSPPSSSPEPFPLTKLPPEMLLRVCNNLSNADIKKLRLTCNYLALTCELEIDRVYISPHHEILDIFYAISNTPKVAARVKEIVWDDSVMSRYDKETPQGFRIYIGDGLQQIHRNSNSKEKYAHEYQEIYGRPPSPWHLAPVAITYCIVAGEANNSGYVADSVTWTSAEKQAQWQSFLLYQQKYLEHRLILQKGEDAVALKHGLRSFPNLCSIEFGKKLWSCGLKTSPLRRFLSSELFWPGRSERWRLQPTSYDMVRGFSKSDGHSLWHGVNSVLRELAHCPASKFGKLTTTVGKQHFRAEDQRFRDTAAAFSKIQHLNLDVHEQEKYGYFEDDGNLVFQNHSLKVALAGAHELEYFRFKMEQYGDEPSQGFDFRTAMPLEIANWPKLKTLELDSITANSNDLVRLFSCIKPTIESVLLHRVEILRTSTFEHLLHGAREVAKFEPNNPKVVIRLDIYLQQTEHIIEIDEDIAEFFGGGPNPFETDPKSQLPGYPRWDLFGQWNDTAWASEAGNILREGFGIVTSNYCREPILAEWPDIDIDGLYWRGRDWVDSMYPK